MATLCQAADPLTEPVVLVLGGADHRSRPVDEQGPQVSVASLADAQQPLLAARAVLPWREPERCGHLPAVGKLFPIAHRRDQRGCDDRPDTAKLLQALIQNSLEQTTLAIAAYGAWLFARTEASAGTVVYCACLFSIGRVLFYLGYARGAAARALGFALTFYPTVGLFILTMPGAISTLFRVLLGR